MPGNLKSVGSVGIHKQMRYEMAAVAITFGHSRWPYAHLPFFPTSV